MLDHTSNSCFNFLWSCHTVSHSSGIILQSYQLHQGSNFTTSSPTLTVCLFACSLIIAILTGVTWYLTVVFICIFLMISAVKLLFMCLLIICIFFFEEMSIQVSCSFLIKLFLCCWVVGMLYIFWILIPYQICFANIFSDFVDCLFAVLISVLWCTKVLIFM